MISADPDYALFCREQLADPYPLYHRLREADPVHWSEAMQLWLVTRYDDVFAGLRDARFSTNRSGMYTRPLSSEMRQRVDPLLRHIMKWILITDEPDHGRLRRLVNLAFTPRMLAGLRPRIERLADELLAPFAAQRNGSFDIHHEFFFPLPATVICEMLGIPRDEQVSFRLAVERVAAFSARGGPDLVRFADEALAAYATVVELFDRLIAERRRHPKDDLISALAAAEENGDRLSQEELFAMCVFIFLAGHDTTMQLMGTGLLHLLHHPDQWQRLRANLDGCIAGAIEECLRFDNSVPRAVRQAKEDVEIRGRLIRAGQTVVFMVAAANRDPAAFPDPDRFDIERKPNKHLSFGFGTHFCLGAQLARMEIEIAYRTVLKHMPEIRLASDRCDWKSIMGLRGLNSLEVMPC